MASDRPFHVCQLAQEQTCSYNSQCPEGQVCGYDGQCRDQCASDRDCVTGQLCKKGNCADRSELDDAGNLPIPDSGAAGAGGVSPGQPCVYNSECAEPLICRNKLCAYECIGRADCSAGLSCIDNRCTGNGPPCVRNSDCEDPLVCRSGQCTDECRKNVDCPAGQAC
ncbi:MAG TPA: hypothetical protein VHM25_21930, partial [Polyangiaceae bacterium]|nr:hypothetical protein [Polyangiaceae bacterium]